MLANQTVYGVDQFMDGACGINNLNGFYYDTINEKPKKGTNHWAKYNDYRIDLNKFKRKDIDQGGPLIFTSFANTPVCKDAYDILCRRFTKVYQSPLTPNKFHGPKHHFFFCVFDISKELK